MAKRLAIFHPPGRLGLRDNPFGKDVANLELFRALAEHGGFEAVDVLGAAPVTAEEVAQDLGPRAASATRLHGGVVLNQAVCSAAGALLRGQPDLHDLAWLRRRAVGDRAYSLLGLVHTIAPPAMREVIAASLTGPVQPWDAVICTSPSVKDALAAMFAEWGEHLAERTGGRPPPAPRLPVVPLGVDGPALGAAADLADNRRAFRSRLGLADGDVLLLWVGRLSYYEKAFPQPMFLAAQQAARETGAKLCFAMVGWFPGEQDEGYFRQAAQVHAPDVDVRFLNGNDRRLREELWAGADLFVSLVDNIQETFGITPLEAMAAGLPVVASDWDGYRYTMRHGREAFLIPTLMGPSAAFGESLVLRHSLQMDSYQAYVGIVAQHTAVHVGVAASAIAELIARPELRRRMGAAGRARVAASFDWRVIARQYHALADELAEVRGAASEPLARRRISPVKSDPFQAFAGFATHQLTEDTRLRLAADIAPDALGSARRAPLDNAFSGWRGSVEEAVQVVELLRQGPHSVAAIAAAFPDARGPSIRMSLVWLAKLGVVDWLDEG